MGVLSVFIVLLHFLELMQLFVVYNHLNDFFSSLVFCQVPKQLRNLWSPCLAKIYVYSFYFDSHKSIISVLL